MMLSAIYPIKMLRLSLTECNYYVCLMVFNITFNNISAISWRKPEDLEKTINLSQVTDKLDQIMLYTSP